MSRKDRFKQIDKKLEQIEQFKKSFPTADFSRLESHYVNKRVAEAQRIGAKKK